MKVLIHGDCSVFMTDNMEYSSLKNINLSESVYITCEYLNSRLLRLFYISNKDEFSGY